MATQPAPAPLPDDRAVQAAMKRLKQYNQYKTRQLQEADQERPPVEDALLDIERWALDVADDGVAWAEARQAEADKAIAEGEYWRDQLRRDQQHAARDAAFREQVDMSAVKEQLRAQLDKYEATLREQAADGQAWAKKKLQQSADETGQARRFLESDRMDKAFEITSQRGAQQRRKRQVIGERMIARGDAARQWKAEHADQPTRYPAEQRAAVRSALDNVDAWAAQRAASLELLGPRAEKYVAGLRQVPEWTADIRPLVDSSGRPLAQGKHAAAAGVIEARKLMASIENFEATLEQDADESLETFRRWTDRNNALARHWAGSESAKHRKWAEAWLKTQEPGAANAGT